MLQTGLCESHNNIKPLGGDQYHDPTCSRCKPSITSSFPLGWLIPDARKCPVFVPETCTSLGPALDCHPETFTAQCGRSGSISSPPYRRISCQVQDPHNNQQSAHKPSARSQTSLSPLNPINSTRQNRKKPQTLPPPPPPPRNPKPSQNSKGAHKRTPNSKP